MTNKEAIKWLKRIAAYEEDNAQLIKNYRVSIQDACNKAVEALEKRDKDELDDIYAKVLELRKKAVVSVGSNYEYEISADIVKRLKDELTTSIIPVDTTEDSNFDFYMFGIRVRETAKDGIIRLWKEVK